MSTDAVKIRFLEIGMTSGRAKYSRYVDVDSTEKKYKKVIADAVDLDALPNEPRLLDSSLDLDIDIGSVKGMVVFAIRLPSEVVVDGNTEPSHLVFQSTPFLALPSNYKKKETYISEIEETTNPRWAWFACDLTKIRKKSEVAKKIKELHHHHLDERLVMRIPFMLNVIDTQLGFAPWMYPPEALPLKSGNLGAITTHGGVHPTVGNYVTMDLTE